MATLYLRPNAAGDATTLWKEGDDANWKCVDDLVGSPDDNTTYVRASYPSYGPTDYYNLTSPPSGISTINSVTVHFRIKNDGAPTYFVYIRPYLRLNGVNTTGTQFACYDSNWTNYNQVLARPGGGSWTEADLEVLQVGIYLGSNGYVADGFCTQIYVEVDYTPPVLTQKSISDAVSLAASLGARRTFKSITSYPVLGDAVSSKFTGAGPKTYNKILEEALSLADNISVSATQIYMKTLSEVVSAIDSITKAIDIKRAVTDMIQLVEDMTFWSSYSQFITNIITTGEEVTKTVSKTVTDSFSITDSMARSLWKSIVNAVSLVTSVGVSLTQRIPVLTKLYLIDNLSIAASGIFPQLTKLNLTDTLSIIASHISYAAYRIEIDMRLSTESYLDMTLSIEGGGDK